MILKMPLYCKDFKCIADRCSDSCCIGWEIDIDKNTVDYYKTVSGDFGEKLKNNINFDGQACFRLDGERCPFLNERNLCEIIINLGEDKISEICTEHPRYYEWFDGVKEGGIGMCCEEAARLILSSDSDKYTETEIPSESCDDYDEELYGLLLKARENISDILRNPKIPLKSTVSTVLGFAEKLQLTIDNFEYVLPEKSVSEPINSTSSDIRSILDILYELEPIDEKWKPFILGIKNNISTEISSEYEAYIRNIGIYFIWRYFMKGVFDEEILSKVKLAVISMAVTGYIFTAEKADFKKAVILAKNYSKEIEYSEENLDAIYDYTYEDRVFSSESLTGLF